MLTLRGDSLDWALRHALLLGDTDLFPRAFEYEAIQYCWSDVKQRLQAEDALKWRVRPHRVALSAKAQLGFRVITQLDPLDFLMFAALVREVCQDIEARRIPITKEVVFSHRVQPSIDGRLYSNQIGYPQFVDRADELTEFPTDVTHVAVTDISDFYARIYHHRLQGALDSATRSTNHVLAIMGLLSGWNGTETFGIPVGSAPARLLAEALLCDVDDSLLANGVKFIRFNDDYRIFAKTFTEAYRHLAILADVLYRNHGLTLQKEKTHLLDTESFRRRFISSAARKEMDSLRDRFGALVRELKLTDAYEPIDYESLDEEQQQAIDSLNLLALLREELEANQPDYSLIRFVLRRFAQLNDDSLVDMLLENIEVVHPVFPDIVRYLLALTDLGQGRRHEIGREVLHLLETALIAELPWHRMWALELFARSTSWNHADQFIRLLAQNTDLLVRRKLILALGRAGQTHWFQGRWRSLFEESAWPRRALIAGASCMQKDPRKHWYKSIADRTDMLEDAVARWAKAHPFAS